MTPAVREVQQPLLDRDDELTRLAGILGEAVAGAGSLTLVEGPAGIGKTALLAAARERADGLGMTVLTARGAERERDLAFGVARRLFEAHVASLDGADREALFSGAAALARRALDPAADGAPVDPSAALHGLYWLTANLAEGSPVLLIVDDAHWADPSSMSFVDYLYRRLEGLPVCMLVACRPEETGPEHPVLDALRQDPGVGIVEPSPLSATAVRTLAAWRVGRADEELASRLHSMTGGNPFYVSAVLAAAGDSGADLQSVEHPLVPDVVRRSVVGRLRRLGQDAVGLAEAFAIFGRVPLRLPACLAGLAVPAAEEVADRLAAADLLTAGPDFDFVHPVVRSAIYDAIPAGRRSRSHRDAGRLLADDGAVATEVAAHLLSVEPASEEWVVDQLVAAAAAAAQQGAPRAAATYLRRALSEPPSDHRRSSILHELSGLLLRAGAPPEAIGPAADALAASGGPTERAAAAIALREALTYSGRTEDVLDALSPVVEDLAPIDPDLAFQVELAMLASSILNASTGARVAERVRELGGEVREGGLDHPHAVALVAMGLVFHGDTPASELTGHARRAAERWDTLPAADQRRFVNHMLPSLIALELYDTADALFDRAISGARRLGSSTQYAAWMSFRSYARYAQGAVLEAEADARGALDALAGRGLFVPFSAGFHMLARLERGDVAGARETFETVGTPDGHVMSVLRAFFSRAEMLLRAAEGDLRGARDGLLALGTMLLEGRMAAPAMVPWRSDAALVCHGLGDRAQATALADEELVHARRYGAPRTLGISARVAGLVNSDRGLLREAVAVLEGSGAALEHARGLVDLGSALRRAGERREARDYLTDGWDRARSCGARALADRAHEELLASGARPRRDALRGRDSLTASELRTARMAAEGLSNPEIAQALFVTRRTVETHLGSAYRKLGISSRADLGAALRD